MNPSDNLIEQEFIVQTPVSSSTPLEEVPLISIAYSPPDPEETLLGTRFLSKGGGMLFIGPSGIGKSSASVQMDILWALGRPAFGITPVRPLKILCIQAENDSGDLYEMAHGVMIGLDLTMEEELNFAPLVIYATERTRSGQAFLDEVVEPLLEKHRPDILRIDPLLAYVSGDINKAETTASFLRGGLNPLLSRYQCAAIINHHTPKVTNRDTSNWRASDWMYAGAGSADLTNWARAILVIDPTHSPHVFRFHAAKRGRRLGWFDALGEPTQMRHFSHAADGIYWVESSDDDIKALLSSDPKKKMTPEEAKEAIFDLVPEHGTIGKSALVSKVQAKGIGLNRARTYLSELVDSKVLFEWKIPRKGTNPELRISRLEQSTLPLK